MKKVIVSLIVSFALTIVCSVSAYGSNSNLAARWMQRVQKATATLWNNSKQPLLASVAAAGIACSSLTGCGVKYDVRDREGIEKIMGVTGLLSIFATAVVAAEVRNNGVKGDELLILIPGSILVSTFVWGTTAKFEDRSQAHTPAVSSARVYVEEGLPVTPRWEAIEFMTEQQLDRYRYEVRKDSEIGVALEESGDRYIVYFGSRVDLHGDGYIAFTHWIDFDGEVYALPTSDQFYARIPPSY